MPEGIKMHWWDYEPGIYNIPYLMHYPTERQCSWEEIDSEHLLKSVSKPMDDTFP